MCWDLRDKFLPAVNALLALIAAFTLALTFYTCSKFYTFLPTSDTWAYTDFLAQAAQGHLDSKTMLVKHNNAHVIALPKLAYFFDAWLAKGTGALVMLVSLLALLATTALFLLVISRINIINRTEKIFLGLLSTILLMSACQVESLLNPANLQWSLLAFSATLTAWFIYATTQKKSAANIAGIIGGMILVTLTSASCLLILIPFTLWLLGKKITQRIALLIAALTLLATVIGELFFFDYLSLIIMLVKNWLKFTVDFLAPPVERLRYMPATVAAGALVFFALFTLARTRFRSEAKETVFFGFLLCFSLFVILVTGIARSHSAAAFTFRFVNLGLLFAAALLPLLYLQSMFLQPWRRLLLIVPSLLYIGLLCYINITEASAFGYGRNHIRLTQVAHALDINDPFVVATMPGTIWAKDDFDYVQANKHKLRQAKTGIYASDEYLQLGKTIDALGYPPAIACTSTIIKMRRLLPDQASWRLLGSSKTEEGKVIARAWFADDNNVIRGFAIPIEPGKNLWQNLRAGQQWAGFYNLETINLDNGKLAADADKKTLTLYAYSDSERKICRAEKIELPAYQDLRKKKINRPRPESPASSGMAAQQ